MNILVIDIEPRWLQHWEKKGATTTTSIPDKSTCEGYDMIIVSEKMELNKLPKGFIVVTSYPSPEGAIKAYLAGAKEYKVKDFRG